MTRQNVTKQPDFTHVRHLKDAGYVNGAGEAVSTPFTLVTKLEDGVVYYKVAFCSRNEKNYVKKKGVQVALDSEHTFSVPIEEATFEVIESAVIADLVMNRRDIMPRAHRNFAELANSYFNMVGCPNPQSL